MKVQKMILSLIVAASLCFIFFSCDAINGAVDSVFLKADEVKSTDLDDFTGTTPSVGDDAAIIGGFMGALTMFENAAPLSRSIGEEDYTVLMRILDTVVPGLETAGDARTVTASVTAAVADETIASDYESGDYFDRGTINITTAQVTASEELDSMTDPSTATAKANIDLEVSAADVIQYEYDYSTYQLEAVERIEEATLNIMANADATAALRTVEGVIETTGVSFYLACDASLGFSYSNEVDGTSGKYVVNVNYIAYGDLTADDIAEIQTGDTDSLDQLGDGLDVIVELYDNNDNLVDSVDLLAYLETQTFAR